MKKRKTIISSVIVTALFSFATMLLANFNLEKHFNYGDYIAEENAYFVEKVDDPAGFVKASKFITPTDEKYNTQKSRSLGTNLISDVEEVWSHYTGTGTTIAIIDDGFDYNHPEFTRSDGSSVILPTSRYYYTSGNYVYYESYATTPTSIAQDWESDGEGGYEWASHGTATSTTAAAPMNNGGGVGVAPEANILALKVDFLLSSIKAAIDYAVAQKVDVINMSLGAYAETLTDGWGDKQVGYASTATYLDNACQAAYNEGIIVVAAAGNEATWRKSYPASNKKVIGVGAIGDWDNKGNANKLAEFTNYVGASQTGEINVDILAPGYVYTAHQSGTYSAPTHTYRDTQGTSFSSPIVAGAAALWKQKYPDGTPSEFLTELQATADGIGTYTNKMINVSEWDSSLNDVGPSNIVNGRLNVANLLDISNPHVDTTQSSLNISVGEKRQISLRTANGTISYQSNDPSIATVNNSGLVEGIESGNTTIVVTATKDGKTATATIDVTVIGIVAADTIAFNPNSITLNVGDTYDAEPTLNVTPSNASRIFLFESFDETVASVDIDTGLVTAVAAGTAEIYALAGYGDGDDSLFVTVTDEVPVTTASGALNFGSASGNLNVNSASISGRDSLNNFWVVTTTDTTSFTPNPNYSQLGSSSKPATLIEFKMTLPTSVTFTSVAASFGGFTGSSAAVSIKVDSTTIGTGTVPALADRTITNSAAATGNVLIISLTNISKGIKAYSITYTYTSGCVTSPPTLEDVQVTNSKTYYPGEIITKNDITVTLIYSDSSREVTNDFVFLNNGYQFTYEDTNGGGLITQKTFAVTYEGSNYNFVVNIQRTPYQAASGETKNISSSDFNSSNLSKSIDVPSNSLVTISSLSFTVTTNAYVFSQGGSSYLSFGKNAGAINNTNPFGADLTAIAVTQKNGARTDGVLTISKNGTTWIPHSALELNKGGYRYFKYAYLSASSAGGAAGYSNIEKISYSLSGQDNATSVANFIMYEDTLNQCLTKLGAALEKLNSMTNNEKNTFWTSNDYVILTARERLLAWARHEGYELTYSDNTFQTNNVNYRSTLLNGNEIPELQTMIVVFLLSLFSFSGYAFLKRKKEK